MSRGEWIGEEMLDVKGGRTSVSDFLERYEKQSEVSRSKPGGKGGGDRNFGYGLKAKGRRDSLQKDVERAKHREELESNLYDELPDNEQGLKAYRAWLERSLSGGRLVADNEVIKEISRSAKGKGGQQMQKHSTVVSMSHTPTGLVMEDRGGRSTKLQEEAASRKLGIAVKNLFDQWKDLRDNYGVDPMELLDEKKEELAA
jgi:hypothetical protein